MDSNCNKKDLDDFLTVSHPPPAERLKNVAAEDLGETETLKSKSLEELKRLIKEHNVTCITRDEFLLRFLRYKKFCVQKSFKALKNYVRFRVYIDEKLQKITPEFIREGIDRKIIAFLPYRDAEGRLLIFTKPEKWIPEVCTFDEIVTVGTVLLDYVAEHESSQVIGYIPILDGTHMPVAYVLKMLPYFSYWKNFLFECLPARYHAVHLLLGSNMAAMVLPLSYPFMPQKIRERIKVHPAGDTLREHISPVVLPQEYGGNLGPVKTDHLVDMLIEHLQKMKDEQQCFLL